MQSDMHLLLIGFYRLERPFGFMPEVKTVVNYANVTEKHSPPGKVYLMNTSLQII